MDGLNSRRTDVEQGLRHRTQQPIAPTGHADQPAAPAQPPPAPTTSTSLTTTMLHGLAAPRTRFIVAGLTAVSLNVGSIPAACALGALYVAGNGINFYQVLCRPRADDDSIRAVDCVLEAFISLLCASLFLRAVNISPETDKSL